MRTKAYFPAPAAGGFDGQYSSLTGKPTFATVATTGAYNDLTGKPTLADAAATTVQTIRTVPQNSQGSGYTLVNSDTGKHVAVTGSVTVPASVFSVGDAVTIYNNSGSSITITQGSSATLMLAGSATTGSRTLAQRGLATVLCVASNTFACSGAGLT